MIDESQPMRVARPFIASTSENAPGGGVSTEHSPFGDVARLTSLLTKDNKPTYVVLRAPRGPRVACACALRTGLVADAFELTRMALRRVRGTWIAAAEPVWPGYVLAEPAEGADPEDLGAVGALGGLESALVRRLGGSSHVIQVSQGRIEDGELRVLFGPLAGLEPLVAHIDRHRRLAWLEPEPGRRLAVGLEVTSKT